MTAFTAVRDADWRYSDKDVTQNKEQADSKDLTLDQWKLTATGLCGYLSLHHGRPLRAQHFDSLEDVHRSFVAHPLQDDTQGDEDTCPPHAGATAAQEKSAIRPPRLLRLPC